MVRGRKAREEERRGRGGEGKKCSYRDSRPIRVREARGNGRVGYLHGTQVDKLGD